ncbi:Lcl C-terminal domain-containing protein [Pseudoalteromonas xiamenensis]
MKQKFNLVFALLVLPSIAFAQTCFTQIPASTPTTRFVVNEDGTVSDSKTGLMWQLCSYGQTYSVADKVCTGTAARVTWQQALVVAKANTTANHDDWHVPNIKELSTVVEHQCVEPSINENVFIGTRNENYWTSTSDQVRTDHAWVYQFADGKNNLKEKISDLYIRLVRFEK